MHVDLVSDAKAKVPDDHDFRYMLQGLKQPQSCLYQNRNGIVNGRGRDIGRSKAAVQSNNKRALANGERKKRVLRSFPFLTDEEVALPARETAKLRRAAPYILYPLPEACRSGTSNPLTWRSRRRPARVYRSA